jgi:hypothetical protein
MGSEREVEHKKRTEVVGEMEQIRSPVATMLQIEYRQMKSELEVERKKHIEVVKEMEQIRSPAVATMLQIEYRRMKSELEVERKKRIDVLEIIKKHIEVVEEIKSKHIVVVEEIKSKYNAQMKEIKSKHIVVVEEIKSKHNAQMKQIQSMICISTNNSDNSKSRTKKIGINEDKMNELKGIMETITTMQKKCLMDAGSKKEDVDILVKSSFYLVGPPGVPPTTIMHSSYKTLGEIHSTKTTNICMQTCHQNLKGESYIMLDQWQIANESIGTGMGEKNSLIKAFGQSGADQIGMLEKFLLSVKDKVNIVSMGQCALSGNLGALSDVHVSHTQNLVTPASGYTLFTAYTTWGILAKFLYGIDGCEAFIHVASSEYRALALCSTSTKKTFDSQELYDLQVQALVSARPALQKCRDTNTRTWTQFRP